MVGLVGAGGFRWRPVARFVALLSVTTLAVFTLAVCSAQAAPPQWVQMTPTASPPARFGDSMAYDAATNQLVLLDSLNGGTWIWDGADWSQAAPAVSPPPATYAQMAYDPATQQLILFGGESFGAPLTDTWNWTGSNWVKLTPATSPPSIDQGNLSWDASTKQLLLYGTGFGTWNWTGSTWTQLTSASAPPPPRFLASMAYDPATTQLLLFGGSNGTPVAETWSWNGSAWNRLTPATSPPARDAAGMAYDAATGQLLLEAGFDGTTTLADQWTWNGSSWQRAAPATSVSPARDQFAMAYDPASGQIVLFGGLDAADNSLGDTWVWTPLTIQTPTLSPGSVGVPYTATLHAAAGTAPYTWSVSSGALPTGLTLSGGGVISGTPTTAGTVTFTVKALDSSTPTAGQATRSLKIVINPAPSAAVWVGNGANSAVNAFPLTGNGNVPPAATLAGSLTALNGVGGLAFDATGDLYVASANSNAIEEFASGAHGNVSPIRVLQGAATGLASPHGIAIDPTGRLYVVNYAANDVTVYAAGASGNAAPAQTISGSMVGPWGVVLDGAGHLWVSDLGSNTLAEYRTTDNGFVLPLNMITGFATQLAYPTGLARDGAGNLLVANLFGQSVLRFAGTAPFGNVAPTLAISGLGLPQGVDLDAAGRVYVADQNLGLNVYAVGATSPTATISGTNTGIKGAGTVAVSPPMTIASHALPKAAVGRRYRARLLAILGQSPIHWSVVSGRPPRGLVISSSGAIAGVPRRPGRYRFTVAARDTGRPAQKATAAMTLIVARPPTVGDVHPTHGSVRGGTTVTISGTRFSTAARATTVSFGRVRAPHVICRSPVRCTVHAPPGSAGIAHVTVTVGGLTSRRSPRDRYAYRR